MRSGWEGEHGGSSVVFNRPSLAGESQRVEDSASDRTVDELVASSSVLLFSALQSIINGALLIFVLAVLYRIAQKCRRPAVASPVTVNIHVSGVLRRSREWIRGSFPGSRAQQPPLRRRTSQRGRTQPTRQSWSACGKRISGCSSSRTRGTKLNAT